MISETNSTRVSLLLSLAILLLASIVGVKLFSDLTVRVVHETTPFDTDEADHANPALELATALNRTDLGKAFSAVTRQSFYPPVHSFVVAPFYLIGGYSLALSRFPTVLVFFAAAVLLYLLVRKEAGMAPAAIAVLLFITSPIAIEHSVLCMLELTGTFLILALTHELTHSRNFSLLGILAFAIFLTKYSFGIISVAALGCTLLFSPPLRLNIKENFKASFKVGGVILGCLAVWLLLVEFSSFYHFFVGHKSYAPRLSQENLLFEIRAWINTYCISKVVAVLSIVVAAIGGYVEWRRPSVRFSVLSTAFALLVLAISTTNEERHFMVALPSLFFLTGVGTATLGAKFAACWPKPDYVRLIPSLIWCPLIIFPAISKYPELDAVLTRQFEGSPEFNELMEFIATSTHGANSILVNGVSDDFGIEALRWYIARDNHKLYTEVKVDSYPYREDKYRTNRLRMRNVDKPWQDESFPKKPASQILAKNYYEFGVQIKNLEKEQRFKKEAEEFSAAMAGFPSNSLERAGRHITIFRLK